MLRDLAAIVLLLVLTSCQTSLPGTPLEALPKTTFVAHGRTYCAIHRVPLVTKRMFEPAGVVLVHYREERCAECDERFPHNIEPRYAPHRSSFSSEPTEVAYCPKCEAAFLRCAGATPCGHKT